MKKLLFIVIFMIIGFVNAQQYDSIMTRHNPGHGWIDGQVLSGEALEPEIFIQVFIKELEAGTRTDAEGKFYFRNVPAGEYTLTVMNSGFRTQFISIIVEPDMLLTLSEIIMEPQIMLLKPLIYVYPEEEMNVSVKLNYDGILTTTYPKYHSSGWNMRVDTNGILYDENDKSFYGLYWEGESNKKMTITSGHVVGQDDLINFLESSLKILGLNDREANEFIIFWLPILEGNAYNLISFATDDYESIAELEIDPIPETVIRVMMLFKPLSERIDFPVQDLNEMAKSRSGYTVVEWGGQKIVDSDF